MSETSLNDPELKTKNHARFHEAGVHLIYLSSGLYYPNFNDQKLCVWNIRFPLPTHNSVLLCPVSDSTGSSVTVWSPMEEEIELQYSPSRWALSASAEEAVTRHVEDVTRASEAARERVPHFLNLQYGRRDGQYCDLYGTDLPEDSSIFVYIHGGYWQMLSKEISAYPVVPLWQAGIRCVIAGYDLAPNVSLDVIVEEIQELAIFIFKMAKEKCSKGVWFGGHSAGAHLTASLLQADWLNSLEPQLRCWLKGVILISGIYDITPLIYTSNNDSLQLDRKSALRLSPLFNLGEPERKVNTKVMMVIGEYDSPVFHGQTMSFSQLLKRKKIDSNTIEIPEADHFTVVTSLQDVTSTLTRGIISFIRQLAP